jgi:ABC-type Fe3+/spermidine/putrescine transport system ATPase subunit
MRLELKALHTKLGLTAIYVTHDQAEAMSLSDRIAVVNFGKIEQISPPRDLYRNPASQFVADFIGRANIIEGKILKTPPRGNTGEVQIGGMVLAFSPAAPNLKEGSPVCICLRPEDIEISVEGFAGRSNVIKSKVTKAVYVGNMTEYQVQVDGIDKEVRVEQLGSQSIAEGKQVYIHIPPESLKFIGL